MASDAPDGTLLDWEDAESWYEWDTLLLGNGLSINVWERFAYRELLDHARSSGLSNVDRALFRDTPNFELVLADLSTAIRVATTCGFDASPFEARYRAIQLALGDAVRDVHLNRWEVDDATLRAIRAELVRFEWVFTTSYDLLLYWAMGAGPHETFLPLIDMFRPRGSRLECDPSAPIPTGLTPVLFLHGALHLIVGADGRTWKLRRNMKTLLEQFGQPVPDDPRARPLLVTEGSSRDKMRAIEGNDYLAYALEMLEARALSIVVFGSSLSESDEHLVDALNEHPNRAVAVSMMPAPKRHLVAKQADIYQRLRASDLIFFDATSHPLGDPNLRVPPP